MNPNHILAIVLILILSTLFSCLIAGDVFLSKIAFSASPLICDSFDNANTSPSETTLPSATTLSTIITQSTISMPSVPSVTTLQLHLQNNPFTVPNNACINLSSTEIGFAKFRLIMFWIMFAVLTVLLGIAIVAIAYANIIASIILGTLGISLWVFMLVGGIYLSKFAFESTQKNCNNPSNMTNYCYNLTNPQIFFAKLTSVLCFPMTFATIIGMALVVIKLI